MERGHSKHKFEIISHSAQPMRDHDSERTDAHSAELTTHGLSCESAYFRALEQINCTVWGKSDHMGKRGEAACSVALSGIALFCPVPDLHSLLCLQLLLPPSPALPLSQACARPLSRSPSLPSSESVSLSRGLPSLYLTVPITSIPSSILPIPPPPSPFPPPPKSSTLIHNPSIPPSYPPSSHFLLFSPPL